ncbi:MAG: UDP-glucose/GDP-mannose dehydrogenase family protein [Candidatus Omnitrophica bacterium]|nr:UDP-glucose/GDP-mannose dehydrogenase family protein [Candidatus Omnitrophota bacterium]
MKLSVVGCGYVGLVSGACLASLGNEVVCVDIDKRKIALLKKGKMPIYEPGLGDLVRENVRRRRLFFTSDLKRAVRKSDVIFIAVGTPPRPNGGADLSFVENVARTIAEEMNSFKIIVEKSTVPVETGEWIQKTVERYAKKGAKFEVASNPEFLREGTAVKDFMHPDRVILGVESKKAEEALRQIYRPLKVPIVATDIRSAEIIKHASNSFLAMKISFINAISNLCDAAKADVGQVALGVGLDRRIGPAFLNAGIGFGGFCFPKDLAAFIHLSEKLGYDFELLRAVEKINQNQKAVFLKKIDQAIWNVGSKTIGVLGLSFKPDTDDMRFAPSIEIIEALQAQGARVRAFDPHAMPKAGEIFKNVVFCKDSYSACRGSDCLVILTEWDEFKKLDLKKVKKLLNQPVIVDGRNIYRPEEVRALGFRYFSMGRS